MQASQFKGTFTAETCCRQFPRLQNLFLYQMQLAALPPRMFEGSMGVLHGVSIGQMGLTELPPDMFKDVGSVRMLWLQNNAIREISSTAMPTPEDAAFLHQFQMDGNPSRCFQGLHAVHGNFSSEITCICSEGLLSDSSSECVPSQCPRQIPVADTACNHGADVVCSKFSLNDACIVKCKLGMVGR